MRPSFRPRLVNSPFDDPGLFIPFGYQKRAIMFDLGDINALTPRDLLKVTHVFVSHTHMDHFIGFDHLLRLCLGRPLKIHLYGPQGFLAQLAAKLAAYTWNLVDRYTEAVTIVGTELRPTVKLTQVFDCRRAFKGGQRRKTAATDRTLLTEAGFEVSATILNHRIACLAFSLRERFHVNIIKTRLETLGLKVGPWLRRFKEALYGGADREGWFEIESNEGRGMQRFRLGDLSDQIARVSPGQKIAYIADAAYTPANVAAMVALAADADHLFIEAAFLERDKSIARTKHHLTAHQAGLIAAKAKVKRFTLFHFSPRYGHAATPFESEAQSAYQECLQR
jgi:ribonuclease Z